MSESLTVDGLKFDVRRSVKRKTLEIIVDRGGELRVAAPEECEQKVMADFIREKRFWIFTKLAEKESLRQPIGTKEFVRGEGFPYLGRSHRLLLVDRQAGPLKLVQGKFHLLRAAAGSGRNHFVAWYREHGLQWIESRIKPWADRLGVKPSGIEVVDLGFRWGSCGQDGQVNFHWAVILLPPTVIDYVLVHELVHLREKNHTPKFWSMVERILPDYERKKQWLAEHGGAMVVL